jgi:cytoskeletal protein CcmA (bactofilin family)
MFTKKETPSTEAATPAPAKRSAMKSKAPSILSADLTVYGSIVSEGEVQLDGSVEGDVRAGQLTIGEEASVKGEVVAESVTVRGRVEGSVRARTVQLASTARVEGDVIHATLSIESGAFFDGQCRRASDPISDKAPAPAQSASQPKPSSQTPSAPPPSATGSGDIKGAPKAAASNDPYAASKS